MRSACFYAVAIAIAVVDQASKSIATARVPFGSSMPLLGGPICIAPTRNPGGAFGLFQSWAGLLTVITVAAVVVIVLLTRRGVPLHLLAGTALALQLGGALGNLIDRLRLGYVLDFIDVQVWPVFNIADSAITLGVLLLVGYLIFCDRKVPESSLTQSGTVKR